MGVDQFLLTWNNHRSNLAEVFTQLRVQDQLVDVTLLCDGGSYPAHRLVLAACSPYFHQLFTRLPTQHPLIYLRDVKQAELEALLEFIYRGEVSVANSELTGLIKIAESLRIKGLGDVSQRDQQQPLVGEKRPSSPPSPVSPPPHQSRPKKAPRLSSNSNGEVKGQDTNFASLLSPANSYGHAINKTGGTKDGFAQLMDSGCPDMTDHMLDGEETPPKAGWDISLSESKLRSCLEGLESGPAAQSLAQSVAQSIVIPRSPYTSTPTKVSSGKKEAGDASSKEGGSRGGCISSRKKNQEPPEGRKPRGPTPVNSLSSASQDEIKDIKIPKEHIKTEMEADSMASGGGEGEAHLLPLYDNSGELPPSGPGDLSNPLLASYRHMLSMGGTEERAFSPLIPTTVQDQPSQPQQQAPSPTNRDSRSLTCQLCGATIKHIANFRRHMKQHLNPRRFPCPWCSAAFGRKDNLKTHTRKHHAAEVEAQEGGLPPTPGHRPDSGEEGRCGSSVDGGRLPGLNGLSGSEDKDRDEEEEEEGVGDREDSSSDHNEGLVIAEDTEEEEEDEDDDDMQGENGQ
ncbi:Protein bric-a-brac 1 [Chionoecetes opilio]|uniref:Protein bric-a-brac 1 n=1 Tax=Chionoecetes opilio TaxID=41210 RepID=A0A8J4YAW7_CHIOP|nr:Protein bric-a-brac 1 [Chionoecetes opilio]